ncbi:hypothetical protein JQX13_23665 [Archangium violaceum]|uniref:tetratricopeptide repeat protein n=1 Tax=Archangium violaceum TaxID=83451 RepID=UPI00193AE417|nr:hypothetical protein [Archangium violaceum]QRK12766.1 hypothetical protein JQX13_23665 [Archangium violaceum]
MHLRALSLLLLLIPLSTWAAEMRGIRLYARGEYVRASRALKEEVNNPRRSEKERARARVYLAASLLALEKTDEARQQLEELALLYPEQRVDSALFPPELVELEKVVRSRLQAERLREEAEQAERERLAAAEEAERRRREQEAQLPPSVEPGSAGELQGTASTPSPSTIRLRPELTGYSDAAGALSGGKVSFGLGLGLTVGGGPVEGTVRALPGGERWAWELEAGYLFGTGAFQPRVALRGTLFPRGTVETSDGSWVGIGGALGGRLALSPQLTLLADVGAEYLVNAPARYNGGVFVISAGVGYNLF